MSGNGFSLYDRYVPLPTTDEEWQSKIRVFVENCEFPCVGAWDGFHVYINSQLKNYFSFKKRYSMMNLGLIGYNKRFLYAAVGAPGSNHDARLLKESSIYVFLLFSCQGTGSVSPFINITTVLTA